ncbi:hypothetical protein PV10_05956 [Exophiala mesophila]|uniref:Uncharacterized protein n=1 Tax=Exophiala mesophila TaxID=212818 RepID=A0A0D1ZBU5_EXOME|nr:uncharacterized protein PV10_05956 [Exophiala mesophila]KIV91414.1 hypothetical protein PV10_05956 [Exophiala mesophila]
MSDHYQDSSLPEDSLIDFDAFQELSAFIASNNDTANVTAAPEAAPQSYYNETDDLYGVDDGGDQWAADLAPPHDNFNELPGITDATDDLPDLAGQSVLQADDDVNGSVPLADAAGAPLPRNDFDEQFDMLEAAVMMPDADDQSHIQSDINVSGSVLTAEAAAALPSLPSNDIDQWTNMMDATGNMPDPFGLEDPFLDYTQEEDLSQFLQVDSAVNLAEQAQAVPTFTNVLTDTQPGATIPASTEIASTQIQSNYPPRTYGGNTQPPPVTPPRFQPANAQARPVAPSAYYVPPSQNTRVQDTDSQTVRAAPGQRQPREHNLFQTQPAPGHQQARVAKTAQSPTAHGITRVDNVHVPVTKIGMLDWRPQSQPQSSPVRPQRENRPPTNPAIARVQFLDRRASRPPVKTAPAAPLNLKETLKNFSWYNPAFFAWAKATWYMLPINVEWQIDLETGQEKKEMRLIDSELPYNYFFYFGPDEKMLTKLLRHHKPEDQHRYRVSVPVNGVLADRDRVALAYINHVHLAAQARRQAASNTTTLGRAKATAANTRGKGTASRQSSATVRQNPVARDNTTVSNDQLTQVSFAGREALPQVPSSSEARQRQLKRMRDELEDPSESTARRWQKR